MAHAIRPGFSATAPVVELTPEIILNRELTKAFISSDPTEITLVPRTKARTASGGYELVDGTPRNPQQFKLIEQAAAFDGVTESGDGRERQYEFILLAEHDAAISIGDHWIDGNGQHWEVSGFLPFNGYETKAGIHSYGKIANHW